MMNLFRKRKTAYEFFFIKQKTAYEISACLVGSDMCISDRFAFDGAAVLTLMEAESAESSRHLELSRNVLVEKVARMSPESRAKLAETLLNGRK